MTREKAIRLAAKWANGGVCTLREGEAKEYHELCLAALREQEQRRWISVEERTPEPKERVLVCSLFDMQNIGWFLGDGRWQVKTAYPDTPTHWMPLPQPPKGE